MASLLLILTILFAGCGNKVDRSEDGLIDGVNKEKEVISYQPLTIHATVHLEGEEDPAGMLQDACADIMVQVRAGNLKGSGVIISSDEEAVRIATASHVLDHMEDAARIIFVDGYEVETSAVRRLEPQDIAILEIPRSALAEPGKKDHGEDYHVAILSKEAFDSLGIGDLVIAMGSKTGVGEDTYAGCVVQDYVFLEDFGTYMLVAEVIATPGMSGGGLFDREGRLLGIICGVSEEGEVAASSILSILALDLSKET